MDNPKILQPPLGPKPPPGLSEEEMAEENN